MAITTTTITKNAGWAKTDVIDQLEQAFTWLGLHGTQISGLVTSISAYSGGGTVGSSNTSYYDVPVNTTSGIGTGATFDVSRSNGGVSYIYVNRPGYGYTSGEYVTLSAANIGGGSAVAIGITVNVDGGASPVGYGSTNQFFDKNLTPTDSNPWGVLKQDFNISKRFGVTYRSFKIASNYGLEFRVGSSFFPYDTTNNSNKGGQSKDSFRGTMGLDIPTSISSSSLDSINDYAQISGGGGYYGFLGRFATTNSPTTHALNLNIYRSGIDPSFAVLSFNQPSISGTLNESTFITFIIHNFNSNLWNLDEVFSAGVTIIDKDPSINTEGGHAGIIGFKTFLVGDYYLVNASYISTRTAEAGWSQIIGSTHSNGTLMQNYNITSSQSNYTSSTGSNLQAYESFSTSSNFATIYSRTGGLKDTGVLDSNSYGNRYSITTYSSVIKGIPINGNLIPCPYYMPDDFVVIDFKLTASGQDIKQGDTITISGNEVYTVITGSYNKYGETAGVLFCARTV
jgi:hypothetical protein